MRVALVVHQFFPRFYTGVERLTLNLASQLQRMGHEPLVVAPASHSSGSMAPYAHAGVRVVPVDARPVDPARPWLPDARAAHALGLLLERERVELVHVMQPMRLPQAQVEAERRGLPVVCQVPDFFHPCARVTMVRVDGTLCPGADGGRACVEACRIRPGVERFAWGRAALDRAAAVVTPSRFARELHAAQGFDTAHWHRIPWGVDYALHPRRLPPPRGETLVLGFLGTLLRHKGAHVAVQALRALPDAHVELRLYGGSFHEQEYEAELRGLAAGDARVSFHGAYDHAGLHDLLAGLDAVVVPSLWHENLPHVGLNAIAAGVPVLASDVGGLRELVDDYAGGFTFSAGRHEALARLIERLASDREFLELTRVGMSFPPSLEEEAWRVEQIYADALGAPPSRAVLVDRTRRASAAAPARRAVRPFRAFMFGKLLRRSARA